MAANEEDLPRLQVLVVPPVLDEVLPTIVEKVHAGHPTVPKGPVRQASLPTAEAKSPSLVVDSNNRRPYPILKWEHPLRPPRAPRKKLPPRKRLPPRRNRPTPPSPRLTGDGKFTREAMALRSLGRHWFQSVFMDGGTNVRQGNVVLLFCLLVVFYQVNKFQDYPLDDSSLGADLWTTIY